MNTAESLFHEAQQGFSSPSEIIAKYQVVLEEISRSATPSNKTGFNEYLTTNAFQTDVAEMRLYADRKTGFENLDEYQFFTPGLYVIGATPAAGKTTFCWQMLEQLARKGESCIYCSYEMSRLELFSKSFAREMFRKDKHALTAAQLRRGASNRALYEVLVDLAEKPINLSVLELQDETTNNLLKLLKPLCTDKAKAPVVRLDYLQIMPTGRESTKLGIDETIRKLKKFQRDTNTTFIVISSFKESGEHRIHGRRGVGTATERHEQNQGRRTGLGNAAENRRSEKTTAASNSSQMPKESAGHELRLLFRVLRTLQGK